MYPYSAVQMYDQESAAVFIQYWWKKSLKKRLQFAEREADNALWKNFTKISLRNDDLIEKLKNLQIAKDIELTKYETILNHPARDVPMLLRCADECFLKENFLDTIKEKMITKKRNDAARVLQRTFQLNQKNKVQDRLEKRIFNIKLKRRLELVHEIKERLQKSKTIRTSTLEQLRYRIALHNEDRKSNINLMSDRQLMILQVKSDWKFFGEFVRPLHNSTSKLVQADISRLSAKSLAGKCKAKMNHKAQMEIIEEMMYP